MPYGLEERTMNSNIGIVRQGAPLLPEKVPIPSAFLFSPVFWLSNLIISKACS
jgi:hypothetical protein